MQRGKYETEGRTPLFGSPLTCLRALFLRRPAGARSIRHSRPTSRSRGFRPAVSGRSTPSTAAKVTSSTSPQAARKLGQGVRRDGGLRAPARPTRPDCVPTPLTAPRARLSFVVRRGEDRAAPAAGPARRPGIDDLSRHDPRGDAGPRGERARVRPRFLSRLFARARGSGQPRVHDHDPEGDRRRLPRGAGRAAALYAASCRRDQGLVGATAEAVKLTENIFRAVNIALVNELKIVYGAMGIDIWEVIEAAKTKPFGFMPFYPGPGLGGHCIPIDPVLSHLEGARVRHHHALHRARRRDQHGHAAPCRRRSARRSTRAPGAGSRAPGSWSSASPTRRMSMTCAKVRRSRSEDSAGPRRGGFLSRPARPVGSQDTRHRSAGRRRIGCDHCSDARGARRGADRDRPRHRRLQARRRQGASWWSTRATRAAEPALQLRHVVRRLTAAPKEDITKGLRVSKAHP